MHCVGSSAGVLFICLFPPGCSPLMSFSPLLIGYTLGCKLGEGSWQAAMSVAILGAILGISWLHALSVLSM
jgi:hypothetical protein